MEQAIGQLTMVLQHGSIPTLPGELFIASLEQAQLEIGTSIPFLQAPFERYGFLLTKNCWIGSIWSFISKHDISLWGAPTPPPPLQRANDQYLMEMVLAIPGLSRSQLISFQRCRLKLGAHTLADICTGDGTRIRKQALEVIPDTTQPSNFIWPTEHPCARDKTEWRTCLAHILEPNGRLRTRDQLGPWTSPPQKQLWRWRYHESTRSLYRYNFGSWWRYSPRHRRPVRPGSSFDFSAVSPNLPPDCQYATATVDSFGNALFEGAAPLLDATTALPLTVRAAIDALGEPGWPLHDSIFPADEGKAIAQALQDGKEVLSACDGSYMARLSTQHGAAAWVVEEQAMGSKARGVCQTSGTEDEVNPYRSELQGIHALLLAVKILCQLHSVTSGRLIVGCDNQGGINKASPDWLRVRQSTSHCDLIRAIRRLKDALPIEVQFVHIYGHQDRWKRLEDLPRLAQLNVAMDTAAKSFLRQCIRLHYTPPPSCIAEEGWSCWVGETKVPSDPGPAIRRQVFRPKLRKRLDKKGKLPAPYFDRVDWPANELAFTAFPQLFRLWATKHISGWCGVNKMLHKWKQTDDPSCPCPDCDEDIETTEHLLACPSPAMRETWTNSVAGFQVWLETVDTDPELITCFITTLQHGHGSSFHSHCSARLREVALEQDAIGWMNFVEGKISLGWRQLQERHYACIGSRRTSRRWASELVTHLLELIHSQWITRNTFVHGKPEAGISPMEAEELRNDIVEEMDTGPADLPPRYHHLFEQPLATLLRRSVDDQLAWRQSVQNARQATAEATPSTLDQMRSFMEDWLHPH